MRLSSKSRIITIGFLHVCVVLSILAGTAQPQQDASGLKLSVAVSGQSYCTVANDAFTTVLHLKLTFTNVSDHPVIVARKFTSAPGAVAKTAEDAAQGQYELKPEKVEASTFPGMSPWSLGPRPPELF